MIRYLYVLCIAVLLPLGAGAQVYDSVTNVQREVLLYISDGMGTNEASPLHGNAYMVYPYHFTDITASNAELFGHKEDSIYQLTDTGGNRYGVFKVVRYRWCGTYGKKIMKGGKWGFTDTSGRVVVAPRYDSLCIASSPDSLAVVSINGRKGVVGLTSAQEIVPATYDNIYVHWQNIELINEQRHGMYNVFTRTSLPLIYDSITLGEQHIIVWHNGQCGYTNSSLLPMPTPAYDKCYDYQYGFATVLRNGRASIINSRGIVIAPFVYDPSNSVTDYYNLKHLGLATITKNDLWGLIDSSGRERSPFIYNAIEYVNEGLYNVQKGALHAILDTNGKQLCDFVYSEIYPFDDHRAEVKRGNLWGIIAPNGAVLVPCIYDVMLQQDDRWLVKKGRHYYSIDDHNNARPCTAKELERVK